ncbi:MAG: ABC transporter permease, partial [Anaerolineae bacterium]
MTRSFGRSLCTYAAIAATAVKANLAYGMWVWADFFVTIASMFIFVYFWRAVYAGTATLGGLTLQQTITYILLARLLAPLVETRIIFYFGWMLRNGQVAVELTRPVDMQLRMIVETFGELGAFGLRRVPLFLLAWWAFGLHVPSDLRVWGAFLISLTLGEVVLFLFDWMFASLAFYATETWGLRVVRVGVASFLSGALAPLAMMPGWL